MLLLTAVDTTRFLRSTLAYTMTTFQATKAKVLLFDSFGSFVGSKCCELRA
jgi:hypothetical protein